MKNLVYLLSLSLLVSLSACRTSPAPETSTPAPASAPTGEGIRDLAMRQAPDELFGELFRRVQMERIFADGKTFVDMIPKEPAADILRAYEAEKGKAGFDQIGRAHV